MGNDNTLDDLILTEPEPEKSKSRGLLALLGLVILLIIVGALLAKMIYSTSDENKQKDNAQKVEVKSDVNNNLDNISNENINKDTTKDTTVASSNNDPDLAPIGDMSMPSSMDTVNVDEAQNNNQNSANQNDMALKGDSTQVAKNEDSLGVAPVGNNIKKDETPPNNVVVKERKEAPKVVKHTKPKEHKVVNKSTPKSAAKTYGGVGNVYIQVGSFTKGPEQSFIRKITRAGFKYRIKNQNGYRRVYVGPFRSRAEAAKYLGIIRSKINSQAFIK